MARFPISGEERSIIRRESQQPLRVIQLIWFALLLAGQFGLIVFLLTLSFAKSLAPRLPVLYNFLLVTCLGNPMYLMLWVYEVWKRRNH